VTSEAPAANGTALAAAASMLVVECVRAELGAALTRAVKINPGHRLGAGPHCSRQVPVVYDALGRPRAALPPRLHDGAGHVETAMAAFVSAVNDGAFPRPQHGY
jgi:3-methyl-2-oxobutanoate hydroxymethyltransferase